MALIAVIGAGGKVGSYIVEQLALEHSVIAIDISVERLKQLEGYGSVIRHVCKNEGDIVDILRYAQPEVLVTCIPGTIAFEIIRKLIEEGFRIVDVSFYPQDAFELSELAKKSGSLYIPDAGIAPGLTNILASLWYDRNAISFRAYVGGLPQNPKPPLYYSAPFNSHDAYDEYLRPARIKQCGNVKQVEPLQMVEWVREFDNSPYPLGAVYTDGLRTLLKTLDYLEMAELTLRYKPHLDYVLEAFFKNGLDTPETKEKFIRYASLPEPDVTYFYAVAKYENGTQKQFTFVHYQQGKHSSMSVLTGSVALGFVDWNLSESPDLLGVQPPENVADSVAPYVFDRLEEAGVDTWELKQA